MDNEIQINSLVTMTQVLRFLGHKSHIYPPLGRIDHIYLQIHIRVCVPNTISAANQNCKSLLTSFVI